MNRPLLAAVLALAFAPLAGARSDATTQAADALVSDAADAFFEVCVFPDGLRELQFAAGRRLGDAATTSKDRSVYPLRNAAGTGTLTLYWDSTCRVDVPAATPAAALARFDAILAATQPMTHPAPEREPPAGSTLQRNVVVDGGFGWRKHLVVLSQRQTKMLSLVLAYEPPPPPPTPPGYPPNPPRPTYPPLDPGPNAKPYFLPTQEISPRALKPARYPASLKGTCVHGVTRVRVTVDDRGRVLDVAIDRTSRNRDLDLAALEAAKEWTFNPGKAGDLSIGGDVIVPVNFVDPCPDMPFMDKKS
jgi:TonB family protein